MKTRNLEVRLMKIEARLDRAQNEVRKALGEVRSILEYHKHARQKTIIGWQDRPGWQKHRADWRNPELALTAVCWFCKKKFTKLDECSKCKLFICSKCQKCGCDLSLEARSAVYETIRTHTGSNYFEDL